MWINRIASQSWRGLDSVFRTSLTGRVGRYVNFHVAKGAGTPVEKTNHWLGELENVDVGTMGVGHLTIDKNRAMQDRVVSAINPVVFGRSKRTTSSLQTKTRR